MLYKVKYMLKHPEEKEYHKQERFAIGDSPEEAIEQAKNFIPFYDATKDFDVWTVGEQEDEMGLYKVTYLDHKTRFSILVPGHSETEAIRYAMAQTHLRCSHYEVIPIKSLNGYKVVLCEK